MNQPKFKFGDKVKVKGHTDEYAFDVFEVSCGQHGYLYSTPHSGEYLEASIELYQEPQKKKLYAYKKQKPTPRAVSVPPKYIFEVLFYTEDGLTCEHGYERFPEFDIEYPDSK